MNNTQKSIVVGSTVRLIGTLGYAGTVIGIGIPNRVNVQFENDEPREYTIEELELDLLLTLRVHPSQDTPVDPSICPSDDVEPVTLTSDVRTMLTNTYGPDIAAIIEDELGNLTGSLRNADRAYTDLTSRYNELEVKYNELQKILNRVYAERDNARNDADAMRTQVKELQNAIPVTEDLLQMIREYKTLCVATTEMWDKYIKAFDQTESEAYFGQYNKLASERDLKARWIADSIIFDVEKV